MEYLYVCHFSNGHIKVGRSINPKSRIASHADRVGCVGSELVEHYIVECVSRSAPAEAALIEKCTYGAKRRNKNEWFEGLDYLNVCEYASAFAAMVYDVFIEEKTDDLIDAAPEFEQLSLIREKNKSSALYLDVGSDKETAIRRLGGSPTLAAKIMGYTSVHAIYMWPQILPISILDRVNGALFRINSCTIEDLE